MYQCLDCQKNFFDPKIVFIRHALLPPPYEKRMMCPYCESEKIVLLEVKHCKYCGAKLSYKNKGEYCNDSCKKRGIRLWELEAKRKNERIHSPLYAAVRRVEEFNKNTGKNLSYGQFFGKTEGKNGN